MRTLALARNAQSAAAAIPSQGSWIVNVSALQTTDIVGGSYSVAFLGMVATTALLLLATGWVGRRGSCRWRWPPS